MVQPTIYHALQAVVPADFRADIYLAKVDTRLEERLRRFDAEVTQGPLLRRHVIPACGEDLCRIADQMYQYRMKEEPIPHPQACRLCELLVTIIEQVCGRNHDHRTGGKARAARNEFNLFEYLIRSPNQVSEESEVFVIDKLQTLPVYEWNHLRLRLANIRDEIVVFPHAAQSTIATYAAKIEEMLRRPEDPAQV